MGELNNFFDPKTIAIIGASSHEEKVGGILMKKALRAGKSIKIIPVNPSHEEIFGIKCYKSLLDSVEKIDLAVIAIPRDFVANALEECGKKDVKEVIIISAGFSEVGNLSEEQKVKEIAKKYSIRFIGPNCFGIFSSFNDKNLDLTFSATSPSKGNIAFISQSGAMWSYLADSFKSFGFSAFVGLGNMGDLEFSDFIDYFSKDKQTKTILLYVEKLRDGRKFIEVCNKCKKDIYVVKAGSSKEGSRATFSHTGSLATDYDIYRGAFRQAGVILSKTLEEALEKISGKKLKKKAKIQKILFSDSSKEFVKIITNAGGAGALTSDYLAEKNIKVSESKDIIGTAIASDYLAELDRTKEKDIIVILTAQSMTEIIDTAKVIVDFKKKSGKNVIALFLGGEIMDGANDIFSSGNVPFFNSFEEFRASLP